MYTVLNSCRDGDDLLYAVKDFSGGGEVEIVKAADLKLLALVGLQAKTIDGTTLSVKDGELVCPVEEIDASAEQESQEDEDDLYDIYSNDEEDESEPAEEESEDESDDYGDIYGDGVDEPDEVCASEEDDFEDIYEGYNLEEDDTPESSVVSKLYSMLTFEQITVLRRYYLWYSQRLFTDAQKDPTFGFKNKAAVIRKQNALNQLRAGGDYRYAGFLDTGSIRAGYTCSLGHPLRFMHLAWDITVGDIDTAFFGQDYDADYEAVIASNNCIAFGIKCIGDFFEVDAECIKALQRAQRDSLKDMALMYEIYTSSDVESVKQSFTLMDEVLKITDRYDMKLKMMKNAEPTIPFSVASFYHQFRAAGMIPPKSLVQEIRSCLVGWTNGTRYFSNSWTGYLRKPEKSFYDRLRVIVRKKYDKVVDKLSQRNYVLEHMNNLLGFNAYLVFVYLMFTYELCGYYRYTATKDGFHDEGGYNKSSVGNQYPYLYRRSIHNQFSDAGFDIPTLLGLTELARLCLEASEKYKSDDYKLPYFAMGKRCHQSVSYSTNFSMPSGLSRIIKAYAATGVVTNRIYTVLKFMSAVVFDSGDVMTSLVSGKASTHKDFQACYLPSRQYDLALLCSTFQQELAEFDDIYTKLLAFAESLTLKDEQDYNAEQERKRIEAEKREQERLECERKEREFEEGDRKLREIERQVESQHQVATPTDKKGCVDYLRAVGVDSLTDHKYDFSKKVLKTLMENGKEPSDRQFTYIQQLYEAVSGQKYKGAGAIAEKVKLADRQDIQDAIAWIEANQTTAAVIADGQGVDDFGKLVNIMSSIKRYGQISERQMKYAEMALAIVEEGKR